MRVITCKVPDDMNVMIEKVAMICGVSKSEIIRVALEYALPVLRDRCLSGRYPNGGFRKYRIRRVVIP